MATNKTYPCLTAEEAAVLIPNGAMVAVSGFTLAGAPQGARLITGIAPTDFNFNKEVSVRSRIEVSKA